MGCEPLRTDAPDVVRRGPDTDIVDTALSIIDQEGAQWNLARSNDSVEGGELLT
jgi:hypothetical protein